MKVSSRITTATPRKRGAGSVFAASPLLFRRFRAIPLTQQRGRGHKGEALRICLEEFARTLP